MASGYPSGSWDAERPVGDDDAARAAALLASRLPSRLAGLGELAYDLSLSWNGGEELFRALDPKRWVHLRHNPVRLLLEMSPARLELAAGDAGIVQWMDALLSARARDRARPLRESAAFAPRRPIAYLCAEFGLHRALSIYGGGLGALAGDFLKQASDSGVPVVGIGFYYQQGYFHQRIDASGWQHEYWIDLDPELRPLVLVSGPDGASLRVRLRVRGREVLFQVWRASVGRTSLYLLDANVPENARVDRWITARLYESAREVRLAQYVALGIGGVRALRALGVSPAAIHLNEGHAALASFELVREGVAAGLDFEAALAAAREKLVFTTHTPVPAGNETFPADEVLRAVGRDFVGLGPPDALAALGRLDPKSPEEPFGMTVVALRTSRRANGVSRRHGEVAREMWHGLWPGRSLAEVPIDHVTNGVHVPTWLAPPMRELLDRHLGADWLARADQVATWSAVAAIPDADLWRVRQVLRSALVGWVLDRSVADRLSRAEPTDYVEAAALSFDPDALTVGFARRVAAYKRLHLLIQDPHRVAKFLIGPRPLQLVIAGKAHPSDEPAKRLIQQLFGYKHVNGFGHHVVFLEDYDLEVAQHLVAGCDLWLNVPRPPLEASGTSGMKSVLNGGLQASVLDGWWAEAFDGDNGWALAADPSPSEEERDARDAAALFDLLEREIVPLFYERDARGVPLGWVRRIRRSLQSLAPRFSAARMLAEYESKLYAR